MRESSTYQAILDEGRDEGRIEEAQGTLLRQGQRKFGSPSDAITASVRAITDLERLHRMTDQIPFLSSWDELLATP